MPFFNKFFNSCLSTIQSGEENDKKSQQSAVHEQDAQKGGKSEAYEFHVSLRVFEQIFHAPPNTIINHLPHVFSISPAIHRVPSASPLMPSSLVNKGCLQGGRPRATSVPGAEPMSPWGSHQCYSTDQVGDVFIACYCLNTGYLDVNKALAEQPQRQFYSWQRLLLLTL